MRNIRLFIEYDGTDFHGWQIQPQVRTVQGELQRAAFQMTGEKVKLRGASRTDAGVHARGQVACFTTTSTIRSRQFAKGLTALTGRDVAVLRSDEVEPGFSARHDARGKIYRYLLWNNPAPSPLHRRTSLHIKGALDVKAMRAGAMHLVGRHDFASFRAADCDQRTTVREMRRIEVNHYGDGALVEVIVEGTAFLQHMVRIMTGTLIDVGRGRIAPDQVAEIRDAVDRKAAGRTVPADGLCLIEVQY